MRWLDYYETRHNNANKCLIWTSLDRCYGNGVVHDAHIEHINRGTQYGYLTKDFRLPNSLSSLSFLVFPLANLQNSRASWQNGYRRSESPLIRGTTYLVARLIDREPGF